AKLQRDKIREAAEAGKGIQPMMMEYYLYSDGESVLLEDHVVSAVALERDGNMVTGYKARDFEPIHLSLISGGLEMVEMIYYMFLNYGGLEAFLTDCGGNFAVMDGGVLANTVKVSKDNRWAAYLTVESDADVERDLMLMKLDGTNQAELVAENVLDFGFLSEDGTLGYFCEDENGVGVLRIHDGGEINDVTDTTFAEDMNRVYYIRNLGVEDGVGMMQHWDGEGEPVTVDGGISSYQYEGFGRLQLLYHYDDQEQTFDLGYYDGEGVTMLDEGVNAIY
ncbi:MAG: hypothetical protein Q4C06_02545, partial [Bacillota bacterium]|nr:hypothetical protein [Bacillota bacterium]